MKKQFQRVFAAFLAAATTSVSIAGMVDFCETRLNDDLSLL